MNHTIPRAALDDMETELRESVARNLARLPADFIKDAIASFLRVHISESIAFCGREETASMLREIIVDAGLVKALEVRR